MFSGVLATRAKMTSGDASGAGREPRISASRHAMPRLSPFVHPVRRIAVGWLVTVALGLAPGLSAADHGGPVGPKSGFDWMTWLLIAGAVAAVSLAAWAFFAPERPAARRAATAPNRSEPEPPAG